MSRIILYRICPLVGRGFLQPVSHSHFGAKKPCDRDSLSVVKTFQVFGGLILALTISFGVTGCANLNLRGDEFPRDETYDFSRQVRPADENLELFGFSNKARQIERNCGVR